MSTTCPLYKAKVCMCVCVNRLCVQLEARVVTCEGGREGCRCRGPLVQLHSFRHLQVARLFIFFPLAQWAYSYIFSTFCASFSRLLDLFTFIALPPHPECCCCCMQQFLISEMSVHSSRRLAGGAGVGVREGLALQLEYLYGHITPVVETLERCVNRIGSKIQMRIYVYIRMCMCTTCLNIIALLTVCLFVCSFVSALYFHKLRRMFNLKAIYMVYTIFGVCYGMCEICESYAQYYVYRELFAHVMYILIFMSNVGRLYMKKNAELTGIF